VSEAASASEPALRLALIGSPNSGKSTLFSALTGLRAKVGNYPGVTVERREGEAVIEGRRLGVIDLPGTYSLNPISPDEAIVSRILAGKVEGVAAPDGLKSAEPSGRYRYSISCHWALNPIQPLKLSRRTCNPSESANKRPSQSVVSASMPLLRDCDATPGGAPARRGEPENGVCRLPGYRTMR